MKNMVYQYQLKTSTLIHSWKYVNKYARWTYIQTVHVIRTPALKRTWLALCRLSAGWCSNPLDVLLWNWMLLILLSIPSMKTISWWVRYHWKQVALTVISIPLTQCIRNHQSTIPSKCYVIRLMLKTMLLFVKMVELSLKILNIVLLSRKPRLINLRVLNEINLVSLRLSALWLLTHSLPKFGMLSA